MMQNNRRRSTYQGSEVETTWSGSNQGRSGSCGAVKFCSCHKSNMTVTDMVAATKTAAANL